MESSYFTIEKTISVYCMGKFFVMMWTPITEPGFAENRFGHRCTM